MAGQTIDYDALAQQAGAISSAGPPDSGGVDYDALAKQAGAIRSKPAKNTQAQSDSIPGWSGPLPGIPPVKLPPELSWRTQGGRVAATTAQSQPPGSVVGSQLEKQAQTAVNQAAEQSPEMQIGRGVKQVVTGTGQGQDVTGPGDARLRGASNITRGGLGLGTEYALPAGIAAAPIRTAATLLPAMAAQYGTETGLNKLRENYGLPVSPGGAALAGDVAGLGVGSKIGGKLFAPKINPATGEEMPHVEQRIVNNLFPEQDSRQLWFQAIKPRANQLYFGQAFERAMPEMKAAEAQLGHPVQNAQDALTAIRIAKQANRAQWNAISGPQGQRGISLASLADAMDASIPHTLEVEDPAAAQALRQRADVYRSRPFSLNEAEGLLQEYNAALEPFYAKYPRSQWAAFNSNPETASLVAKADAIRDAIYNNLDYEGQGALPRELQRRYGALLENEGELQRRVNVAARQQPTSLSQQAGAWHGAGQAALGVGKMLIGDIGGAANVVQGVAERAAANWLKEQQTTDAMIQRAFANYDGQSAPLPPYNPVQPRGLLPPAPHQMPPVADTSFVRGAPPSPAQRASVEPKLLPPASSPIGVSGVTVPDVAGVPPMPYNAGLLPAAEEGTPNAPRVMPQAGGVLPVDINQMGYGPAGPPMPYKPEKLGPTEQVPIPPPVDWSNAKPGYGSKQPTPFSEGGVVSHDGSRDFLQSQREATVGGTDSGDLDSAIVHKPVVSLADDLKILDPVIGLIPIPVVHMLGGKELTAQVLLHNPAMLKDSLAAARDADIFPDTKPLLTMVALRRAILGLGPKARGNAKYQSALEAFHGHLLEPSTWTTLPKSTGVLTRPVDENAAALSGTDLTTSTGNIGEQGGKLGSAYNTILSDPSSHTTTIITRVDADNKALPGTSAAELKDQTLQTMAKGGVINPDSLPDVKAKATGVPPGHEHPAISGPELVRGSLDIPLSPQGVSEATELGKKYAAKGGISRITAGNLTRTRQTAQILRNFSPNAPIGLTPNIQAWHLGALEGKPKQGVMRQIESYIRYKQGIAPAGMSPGSTSPGESYRHFGMRLVPEFKNAMAEYLKHPNSIDVMVVHRSVISWLYGWLKAGMPQDGMSDANEILREKPEADAYRLAPGRGGAWTIQPVDMSKPGRNKPGIFVTPHTSTALNNEETSSAHLETFGKGGTVTQAA